MKHEGLRQHSIKSGSGCGVYWCREDGALTQSGLWLAGLVGKDTGCLSHLPKSCLLDYCQASLGSLAVTKTGFTTSAPWEGRLYQQTLLLKALFVKHRPIKGTERQAAPTLLLPSRHGGLPIMADGYIF